MTIDMELMARSLDEIKDEFIRHHQWIENYFDSTRYSLQKRIEELEEQVADLEIKLEEKS